MILNLLGLPQEAAIPAHWVEFFKKFDQKFPKHPEPKPTSVTFTREQMIADLTPLFMGKAIASIDDIVCGKVNPNSFNLKDKSLNDIINLWCDYCSENFHTANPMIEDVLCYSGHKGDPAHKFWISSR